MPNTFIRVRKIRANRVPQSQLEQRNRCPASVTTCAIAIRCATQFPLLVSTYGETVASSQGRDRWRIAPNIADPNPDRHAYHCRPTAAIQRSRNLRSAHASPSSLSSSGSINTRHHVCVISLRETAPDETPLLPASTRSLYGKRRHGARDVSFVASRSNANRQSARPATTTCARRLPPICLAALKFSTLGTQLTDLCCHLRGRPGALAGVDLGLAYPELCNVCAVPMPSLPATDSIATHPDARSCRTSVTMRTARSRNSGRVPLR
jgi:hypothetical protein